MRQVAYTMAGVVALAGAAGCKTETRSSELSSGRMVDDKHISERVKDDLKNDPVYKFDDVNVSTFGGVVQLSGFVNLPAQKQRAEQLAEGAPGVTRVDNGITLKPQPPTPTGRTNEDNKIYSQ